jgi:Tfp pilus assembly major pilin PilA
MKIEPLARCMPNSTIFFTAATTTTTTTTTTIAVAAAAAVATRMIAILSVTIIVWIYSWHAIGNNG